MNAVLAAVQPSPGVREKLPERVFPAGAAVAAQLQNTAWAIKATETGRAVLDHRIPLLGIEIDAGPDIRWRRDYCGGIETAPVYFRKIPYLNRERSGDHKIVWELNRHQHLVLLAQCYLLTGNRQFLDEVQTQLSGWLEQNPFQRSINWASALEVAFRALSWLWILHFVGPDLEADLRGHVITGLYRHGLHLEYNLSTYFSRNTHLLGEAVALHAIGRLLPSLPCARRWQETGAAIVRTELDHQVLPDGSHFEKSSYYHVYALDLFLFHYLLSGRPADYVPVLIRMGDYLDALMGPARELPLIGDDDGGRLFHPYGAHTQFGRATLATAAILLGDRWFHEPEDLYSQAAWWLGAEALDRPAPERVAQRAPSRLFPSSGLTICADGGTRVLIDAGTFGAGRGGHSHSDTLQILVRRSAEELLVDAGTYTYVGDLVWRDWFRGSAAHNTVRVDESDQADPAGPFGWRSKPEVQIHTWETGEDSDFLDAECRYREVRHRRRVLFLKPELILIVDCVEGSGTHRVEQFWHLGAPVKQLDPHRFTVGQATLVLSSGFPILSAEGDPHGWRSKALGRREKTPFICVQAVSQLPVTMVAVLDLMGRLEPATVSVFEEGERIVAELEGPAGAKVTFARNIGVPVVQRTSMRM